MVGRVYVTLVSGLRTGRKERVDGGGRQKNDGGVDIETSTAWKTGRKRVRWTVRWILLTDSHLTEPETT